MKKFGKILAHFYFIFMFGLFFLVQLNLIMVALRVVGIIALVLTIIYIYQVLKGKTGDSSKTKIIVKYVIAPAKANENVPIKIEDSNNH